MQTNIVVRYQGEVDEFKMHDAYTTEDEQLILGPIFTNMDKHWSQLGSRNHMPSEVWNDITYPNPNFNSCTVEV